MDADSSSPRWLLLMAQLPSTPSSARVALWRRLRAIGATSVVNGTWVLPYTAPNRKLFEELQERARKQKGTGFALIVQGSSPDTDKAITQRFRADRSQEYDEFAERCAALLDEIRKEARAGKYTFAEMEESEQDLEKLARWLAKIQARDFFPDERGRQAADLLARCHRGLLASGVRSRRGAGACGERRHGTTAVNVGGGGPGRVRDRPRHRRDWDYIPAAFISWWW